MRTRKIYWILSVAMLCVICSLLFNYFYKLEKKSKIEEVIAYQKVHAHLATRNFEHLFRKWNNILCYLSEDNDVILMNDQGKNNLKKIVDLLKDEIKGTTRTDSSGKIIFTIPDSPKAIGADISRQNHMKLILAYHQPVISDVFLSVQGYQSILIHYPVIKNERYCGSIAFNINFEKLTKEILEEIKIGQSGCAWMISSNGTELFCKDQYHIGNFIDNSHSSLSIIADSMRAGKTGISAYTLGKTGRNDRKFAYYLPIKINNTFWSLAITYSEKEITASLVDFRNHLLFIFTIIFLGGTIFTFYGFKAWVVFRESELRKIVEKKLKETEEKYRIVIETTDTGYAITDRDGVVRDANMKFTEMAGYSVIARIIGKSADNWTSAIDYERFCFLINKCLNEGSVQNLELEFRHANGKVIPVEINARKVKIKNKERIIMLCRNNAEKKQSKEELMKERTLLRTLIDNLPSGVFIKDAVYRKTIANSLHIKSVIGHLKRTGLNADIDIIGKTDFEVFTTEEANTFLEDDSKVIENGRAIINKVEPGWGANKERIWLLISKVPIKAEDGTIIGMVGITTDITDQKKVEEQLIIAKEKAEQSDRLKTAFLNNISHEIRTPLNAVIGFSGLLKDPEIPEEKKKQYIDIILQSSNQLLMIITDIINIATIEAGQLQINTSITNINSILNILHEQYSNAAHFKHLAFNYSKGLSDEQAIIETDETKLIEILSNLVNNAIKFTHKGSVSFGYILEDNFLVFFVEDSGIGIKSKYHKAIFDRFWQVENSVSYNYGGTGLGLSISKTYTELLGGNIWLTSESGVGTTFYFTLPYKKVVRW